MKSKVEEFGFASEIGPGFSPDIYGMNWSG